MSGEGLVIVHVMHIREHRTVVGIGGIESRHWT